VSATNRGSERNPKDFYATPKNVICNFLDNHTLRNGPILDPSAGHGVFGKVLNEYGYYDVDAVEVREEEKSSLTDIYENVYINDFLSWTPERDYKTIITNPPFSLAMLFIKKCFELQKKDTEVIMLLGLAFLESKKRHDFWQGCPVNNLYVLSNRPSFTNNGKTDACAYAFYVWNNSGNQVIKVI